MKGYFYDLSDPVQLTIADRELTVEADTHPDLSEVAYVEVQASSINQGSINNISINGSRKRLVEITFIDLEGDTCITGASTIDI